MLTACDVHNFIYIHKNVTMYKIIYISQNNNIHCVVCNTEIMVLLITLNSHFHTNQYKLYSYSSYHMLIY